ncbi:hypothetical protein GJ744_001926 [Endocarpon pusillum]|uniref:Amidoligase enzyme n=1 Tax=Endocarpon pusillum TaxID=364733 RepID=A0A8H7ANJ0_9EURO|nr:hypothetical protein GJ744_001926 [Endocarpon pusillum]
MLLNKSEKATTTGMSAIASHLPHHGRRTENRAGAPHPRVPSSLTTTSNLPLNRRAATSRSAIQGEASPGRGVLLHTGTETLTSRASASSQQRSESHVTCSSSSENYRTSSPSRRGKDDKTFPRYFIGIETEFLLQGRNAYTHRGNLIDCVVGMARLYNKSVEACYPRMDTYSDDDEIPGHNPHKYWILTEEKNLKLRPEDHNRWCVEMKTPKIEVADTLDWASQVKRTWAFIKENYDISQNGMCGTHVHISMQRQMQPGTTIGTGMALQNLKNIAKCAIHFEPALEALVPENRRGNLFAKSNWIDNINFADASITRQVAMNMIDTCGREIELIKLMCPPPQRRCFAWNFWALKKFGTIEFRKGSASLDAADALAWAELTILFVQAAVKALPDSLLTRPANIEELRRFLSPDKLRYLKPMFDQLNGEESVQPELLMSAWTNEEAMLRKKLSDDARLQKARALMVKGVEF